MKQKFRVTVEVEVEVTTVNQPRMYKRMVKEQIAKFLQYRSIFYGIPLSGKNKIKVTDVEEVYDG